MLEKKFSSFYIYLTDLSNQQSLDQTPYLHVRNVCLPRSKSKYYRSLC